MLLSDLVDLIKIGNSNFISANIFEDIAKPPFDEPSRIRTVISADFDNDGYDEVFMNNIGEPNKLFKIKENGFFEEIKTFIENTPRTEIVEIDGDYLHAEATSKWMKYVDDLEVSFLPESNILSIRSESRVGDSDLGVNQKRVDLLKSKMF